MADYPINLNVSGRRCLVVGGGPVAARKVKALLDAGADVRVVAPAIRPEIEDWERAGRLRVRRGPYVPGDIEGATLAVAATGSAEVNRAVASDAGRRGILVNVADDPAACDFTVPAVVRGREWSVAISTGGASPALARWLRRKLEAEWGSPIDTLLEWLGEARRSRSIPGATQRERAEAVARVIEGGVLEALRDGDGQRARSLFEEALRGGTTA